jgi:hypothetical protein
MMIQGSGVQNAQLDLSGTEATAVFWGVMNFGIRCFRWLAELKRTHET